MALVRSMSLDLDDVTATADQVGLGELARRAIGEAEGQ